MRRSKIDPKLRGDSGEVPIPNGMVGGLIQVVKFSPYLINNLKKKIQLAK